MSQPDFVVIGAMKCATSSLHALLGAQPDVWMPELKEPNFFSDDRIYERGLDWYESLFEAAPAGSLCGESSTHYTKRDQYPRACERLHQHNPSARLVYVMRHPIDRLLSHYEHGWTEGDIRSDVDEAILQHPELVLQSCYAWQIAPYLKRFGADHVLPVFFERLINDPSGELRRILRHLGDPEPVCTEDLVPCHNRSRDRRRAHPTLALARHLPASRFLASRLPKRLHDRIADMWKMRERPSLSAESSRRIRYIFDRDLDRLGRWLGSPLSCESYATAMMADDLEWSSAARTAA